MGIIENIKEKVKKSGFTLLLPEARDKRVIEAASVILEEGFAGKVILLGRPEEIKRNASGIDISGACILDYMDSPEKKEYAERYYRKRKAKGMSISGAEDVLCNPVYYGMFMVKDGIADACVCGSVSTTAEVLRAGIHILGIGKNHKTMSSCFLMIVPNCPYGQEGAFIFADAGAVPDPSPEQLADIAVNTSGVAEILFQEARTACLSFSTKGSGRHPLVEKVKRAVAIAKEKAPDLIIDGELQADSALVPEVARRKLKESPVAGRANVLIFPDLNSGNISYKLVQRLTNAEAYGPLVLGLSRPISDLSRGCSVRDIVNTSALILLLAGVCK